MTNIRTPHQRILCAKCCKPVDRTEWWDDYKSGDRAIRVYCHGATEEMRMQRVWVEPLNPMRLHPDTLHALESAQGVAFADPNRLPQPMVINVVTGDMKPATPEESADYEARGIHRITT